MMNVVAVVGPTASGKSALAVEIAKNIDGEIISADSMQIYRGMDIGTAKPTKEEMGGIPHHMLDVVSPNEEYSVSDFQTACFALINDISARGKVPVICGGTGLYINSVTYKLDFGQRRADGALREKYERLIAEKGNAYVHSLLDEASALRIHVNDTKRVIRALERSDNGEFNFNRINTDYHFLIVGIDTERALLYERINKRVDDMVNHGLIDEAKEIYKCFGRTQAAAAIGYKELFDAFEGKISVEQAIENIKQSSRRYAKRQMTWFKRDERIKWYNFSEYVCYEDAAADIITYIKAHLR